MEYVNTLLTGEYNGVSNKLEEVWSIRRNIGVAGRNSTVSQLTNMYSRHGALPAAQTHLPPGELCLFICLLFVCKLICTQV